MHAINYETVTKRENIFPVAEEFAYYNVDREENPSGSYHGQMTIHDDLVYDTFDEAKKAIERLDRGFYDDHAVKYHKTGEVKESKTLINLRERLAKEQENKVKYEEGHAISNFKAALVTCKRCTSKINKAYLKNNRRDYICPVCGNDLRAEYVVERIKKFDDKIADLKNKVKAEEEKCKKKAKSNQIVWLVKMEVHC